MKQKLLNSIRLRLLMLLAVLVSGINAAWGDETEVYSATFTSVANHSYTQNKTFTLSEQSWTSSVSQVASGIFYLGCNSSNASKGILGKNDTFADEVDALKAADPQYNAPSTMHAYALKFDHAYSSVTKVNFSWSGGNNAFQVYLFGDTGSGYILLSSTNYATSGSDTSGSVEWSGSATDFKKFAIVARPGTTTTTATNKTLRAATFTIYESAAPAYTITAQSNNIAYGTVTISGSTITATPAAGYRYATPAYTVSPANSADVEQNGNEFSVTPSENTTVTINFEAIPTHTATFSINGNTDNTANFAEGADIIFPNAPADIDGKKFVGWVTSTIDGTTVEAPSFVTSATMGNADITYYAVFAIAEGSGEDGWIETALTDLTSLDVFVFSNGSYAIPTDNGTSNAPAATSITVAEGKITSEVEDNLKWNVSGNTNDGYTFYPNGTTETWLYCNTTASSSSNNNIRVGTGDRKVWRVDNNGYLVTNDTYADRYLSLYSSQDFRGYTGTGNGAFVPKFYKLTSGTSYSEYCTSVVAAAVESPTITVDSPFTFSASVKMTCDTEGATIYYTLDGTEPSSESTQYTEPFNINATTTIKAIAIKGNDQSHVATVTAAKNLAEPTVAVNGDLTVDLNGETNVSAGTLTAAVTYNEAAVEGAVVEWSSSDEAIATIDANTGAVILLARGEVTFTATYAGNEDYAEATGTKTITVINSQAPGTEARPYTVAEAIAAAPQSGTSDNVYVKGIVSSFYNTSITGDGNNYRYYISDDGTTSNQLLIYKGKGLDNVAFANVDDLLVGDVVTIVGGLTMYQSAPEVANGNYIVSLTRKPAAALTSIALSGEYPTSFNQGDDFSHEGMTVTATYDDETEDDVTEKATFTGYDMNTTGNQTVTVSYTENEVTKTATYDITVNALPTYTVTYGDGGSVTEVSGGAGVTLATREAIGDYEFAGWSEINVSSETTQAPTIIGTSETYYPSANITLYPVYTRTEGGGGAQEETASVTISDYASENSWENATKHTSVAIDEKVSAIADGAGNTGKYYTNGNDWRFYQNESATVTILAPEGTLSTVTFTFNVSNSGTLEYESSAITSGEAVEVSGTSAEFSVGNSGSATNGQVRITAIEVTYTAADAGTTYYWSSPVAAAVESPTITVDSPFTFSASVEMTCATDGATIYYTLDGTEPGPGSTEYTNKPFDINATTTIKAIAIKGNDQSRVTTVTATKNLAEPTVAVSGDLTVDLNGETNVNAGTLTAAVTYNEAAVQSAVVVWSSSDTDIATIDANGAVTLLATGEVTFTATYAGNEDYAEATGTKTITVINSQAPGTEARPYTVAEAIAAAPQSGTSENVYVKGIVSSFYNTSITGDGNNYRYYISDDGTTSNQLLIYKGKGLDNVAFANVDDLLVGDVVTIVGGLTMYQSAPEVANGNYIVSLTRKPAATITVEGGTEFNIDRNNGEEELQLTATANSDATVVFTVDTENTTLDAGNYEFEDGLLLVSGNTAGVIVIKANAPAAGNYNAATEVTITVNVLGMKSEPTIDVQDKSVEYGSTFVVDDSMIEGGDITVTSSNESVATVSGLTITPAAVGTTTITVSTAETAEYKAGSKTFELTIYAPAGKTKAPAGNTTLFAESFGNNTGSARDWNDSYSVKSGVAAVYSGITGYTVSNARQGKNSTGSTQSGLNQSTSGTDAYIIIGPLNVADYSDMTLTYQWKAGSIKGTYTTSAYYATSSEGEYTEMSGTGDGATTFVERSYSVPAAAQVSTLYLKIVWNTSNTQAIIDEVQLTASGTASTTVQLNTSGYGTFCSVNPMDFTAPEGYTAWRISSINMNGSTGTINCEKITDAIKGGQGVLLYNKNAGGVQTEATINFADGDTEFDDVENLLRGTTAPTFVEAGEVYGLVGNEFVPSNADGVMPAGKAYLEATSIPANVKAFIFVFNDDATGITETRKATREEVESIFNLGGQRMSKMQRGVNIVNGKKVLVK